MLLKLSGLPKYQIYAVLAPNVVPLHLVLSFTSPHSSSADRGLRQKTVPYLPVLCCSDTVFCCAGRSSYTILNFIMVEFSLILHSIIIFFSDYNHCTYNIIYLCLSPDPLLFCRCYFSDVVDLE